MLRTLIDYLAPPADTAYFDRYQVGFVRICGVLIIVGALLAVMTTYSLGRYERTIATAPFTLVGIGCLWLLARGRARDAVLWMVFGMWLGAVHAMTWAQGVMGPGVGTLFAIIILLSGWLLGSRVSAALVAGTIVVLWIAALAAAVGWDFPRQNPISPLLAALMLTILMAIAGALGHFAARSLRERLEGLRQSQRRFELLFRAGPAARALAIPDGAILDCNEAFCDLLGRPREAIIGRTANELTLWADPADRAAAFGILERETAVRGFEARWRHASGELRHVLLQWQKVDLDGEPRLLTQVVDITRQKTAEAALRESEEKFSRAFHASPEAQLITRCSDQKLTEANAAFERLSGYSRDEALGRTSTELGLWADPGERDRLVADLAAGTSVVEREITGRHRGGGEIACRLTATLVEMGGETFMLTTMRDVTVEARATAALAERERELELQLSLHELTERVARVGHWVTQEAIGRVEWSVSLSEISGFAPGGPMTSSEAAQRIKVEPEDRFEALRQRLDGRPEVFHFRRLDGQRRWARVSATRPPGDEKGESTRVFGVVQDITEEHEAKIALETLNVELERRVSERTVELRAAVEELDAFSYSIAHDLKAPLRSVHAFASLLEEDAVERLTTEDRKRLSRIRESTLRMGELIADLLELSRVTRSEMRRERVDLTAIARRISAELAMREPDRQIRWRIAEGLAAFGDRGLLHAVLENLLDNAWKYSRKQAAADIEFGRAADGGEHDTFFVRDNGAGFDAAHAGTLFKPFSRLHGDAEFEGTGVGLATVHRIMRRHGGSVRAESEPGRGATFYFTLPAGSVA